MDDYFSDNNSNIATEMEDLGENSNKKNSYKNKLTTKQLA